MGYIKEVLEFAQQFGFYEDLDDSKLFWVVPRYSASAKNGISLNPIPKEVELHSDLGRVFKKVSVAIANRWDPNNEEFANNYDCERDIGGAMASSVEFARKSNDAAMDKCLKMTMTALSSLSEGNQRVFIDLVTSYLMGANKPIDLDHPYNLKEIYYAVKSARSDLVGDLILSIVKGLTAEELMMLNDFKAILNKNGHDFTIKTLPTTEKEVKVAPRRQSESGKYNPANSNESFKAIRNVTAATAFASIIPDDLTIAPEGGKLILPLDANAYESVVSWGTSQGSGNYNVPTELPLKVFIKSKFITNVQAKLRCQGHTIADFASKIEFEKYSNDDQFYARFLTSDPEVHEAIRPTCEWTTPIPAHDQAILGELKAQYTNAFLEEFGNKVSLTTDAKLSLMKDYLSSKAESAFKKPLPINLKNVPKAETIRTCISKPTTRCVEQNKICFRTFGNAKVCVNHGCARYVTDDNRECSNTVRYWNEYMKSDIPVFYADSQFSREDLAKIDRIIEVRAKDQSITFETEAGTSVCIKGVDEIRPGFTECAANDLIATRKVNSDISLPIGSPSRDTNNEISVLEFGN